LLGRVKLSQRDVFLYVCSAAQVLKAIYYFIGVVRIRVVVEADGRNPYRRYRGRQKIRGPETTWSPINRVKVAERRGGNCRNYYDLGNSIQIMNTLFMQS